MTQRMNASREVTVSAVLLLCLLLGVGCASHSRDYGESRVIKILQCGNLATFKAVRLELGAAHTTWLAQGTREFVLYLELPSGARRRDRLSYSLYRDGTTVVDKALLAVKSDYWQIRRGDSSVHLVSGTTFRNTTEDEDYASTPSTAAVEEGITEVCLRTVIGSETSVFASGDYRLDILRNDTPVRSLQFVVE